MSFIEMAVRPEAVHGPARREIGGAFWLFSTLDLPEVTINLGGPLDNLIKSMADFLAFN
jgi:hypothetical protein